MYIYVSKGATDRFSWKKLLLGFLGSIAICYLVTLSVVPIEMQRASDLLHRPTSLTWSDVPRLLSGVSVLLPFVFPILAINKAINNKAEKEAAQAEAYRQYKRGLKEQQRSCNRAA